MQVVELGQQDWSLVWSWEHDLYWHKCSKSIYTGINADVTDVHGRTECEDRICNCKIINLKPHYLGRIEPRRIEAWWLKQWAAEGQKPWTTSTFSLDENHRGTFWNRQSFTRYWFQSEVWRMHIFWLFAPTSNMNCVASHIILMYGTLYLPQLENTFNEQSYWLVMS